MPKAMERRADWNSYIDGAIDIYAKAEQELTDSSPIIRFVSAWLRANKPPPVPLSVVHGDFQPGNILVAVRHPHALEHVAAALQGGADREVVVMTVRLHGVDTDSAGPDDPTPLPAEHSFGPGQLGAADAPRQRGAEQPVLDPVGDHGADGQADDAQVGNARGVGCQGGQRAERRWLSSWSRCIPMSRT